MLALRLLWRNWRSGEVKILASALVLAVAVVCAISVFTDRLELALVKESSRFLGADRVISSSHPFQEELLAQAASFNLRQAQAISFPSMVFAGDNMGLASVKAVSASYPLLGEMQVSATPFAQAQEQIEHTQSGPPPGEVWVDSRLLALLKVELGQQLQVGESLFQVTQVIIDEPDRGSNFQVMGGPRLMMNLADLPATEVVQPGSQVNYRLLLAAENERELEAFLAASKSSLTEHQRLLDLESSEAGLARTLDRGRSYLLLAGIVGVLLAGVAIAIAAQRFSSRHIDQVALMKSLGAGAARVRMLYFSQLILLASFAAAVGLILGEGIQRAIAAALASLFPVQLEAASASAYGLGVLTGFVCLVFFALPPLWHLPSIPPLKILRREMPVRALRSYTQGAFGVFAVLLLILVYSGDSLLTLAVFLALASIIALASLVAYAMLKVGRQMGMRAGSVWRLALASLQRNRGQSTIQILVFATAIMLLLALTTIRGSLMEDWEMQLPKDAPNHFFVNIAPNEVESIEQLLSRESLSGSGLYPMVRARLTHINGEEPARAVRRETGSLRRELNLSWTEEIPEDNKLVEGEWWGENNPGKTTTEDGRVIWGVSVEQMEATAMGLQLGDELRFSIGGLQMDAKIESIRALQWESMRPNFFFLMAPGALDGYSPTYLTSVFIPPEKKSLLNEILRSYPTVLVIELDKVMNQIRRIIDQVSSGVGLVLWLVFGGGFLVLLAAVNASMESRLQEAGLLRALGSSRNLVLGSVWAEFSVLGFFAGLLAVLGSEVLLIGMQSGLMDLPVKPHLNVWITGISVGTLVIGLLGVLSCRGVVTAAPAVVLREISA